MDPFEEKARTLADLFMRLGQRFQAQENEFFQSLETELTIQELKVIFVLSSDQPSIMREISDHLNLSVSTITRLVDGLESKGLVTRRRPEDDRRSIKVELTANGREISRWYQKKHLAFSRGILRALDESDRQLLLDLLRRVLECVQAR
jgi:DNA-binding MarR family transcriptional regulator